MGGWIKGDISLMVWLITLQIVYMKKPKQWLVETTRIVLDLSRAIKNNLSISFVNTLPVDHLRLLKWVCIEGTPHKVSKSTFTSRWCIKFKQRRKWCRTFVKLYYVERYFLIWECNASHLDVMLNPAEKLPLINAVNHNFLFRNNITTHGRFWMSIFEIIPAHFLLKSPTS